MIADAGPNGHPSNETVIENGIISVITSRANSVGNILKTEERNPFQSSMEPR